MKFNLIKRSFAATLFLSMLTSTSSAIAYKPISDWKANASEPRYCCSLVLQGYKIRCPMKCPDRRTFQDSTTNPQSFIHLAYDPDARDAKAQEHAIVRVHDRAVQKAIEAGRDSLRNIGSPSGAINDAGRALVRECASCHIGGRKSDL